MESLVGQTLGSKYTIEALIGRGGMGVVYRAYDTMLERRVAVKVLPGGLTDDPEFVARFHQEAVTAARLHHPGIVTIFDVGQERGIHYIVMQYLAGVTLHEWLAGRDPLLTTEADAIVTQLGAALDYAHKHGVIHRDFKPSNIMIAPDGQTTLMDFGLVRAGEGSGLTLSGIVVGTPEYMAPEQALGEPVDARTDIYALGVVIYRLLTGQVPFARSTSMATAYAHVHEPPPPLRQIRPEIPKAVEKVVLRALAKSPAARYQSAGQLAVDFALAATGKVPPALRAFLVRSGASAGATAVAAPSPPPQSPPADQNIGDASTQMQPPTPTGGAAVIPTVARPRTRWLLTAAAALVILLLLVWVVMRPPSLFAPLPSPTPGSERLLAPVTATPSPTSTATLTSSPTPAPVTPTATPSATPTVTTTPSVTPTVTATATGTPSPTPTTTRRPLTATPTRTRVPPTATPLPSTNTPEPPTNTPEPPPSDTPEPSTNTPAPDPTNTPAP